MFRFVDVRRWRSSRHGTVGHFACGKTRYMTKTQLAENIIKDKVQYRVVGHDGIKEYFCPAKTDGVICNYCVAKKLEIQ